MNSLRVHLDVRTGKLHFKHWTPRSRWRGPFADMAEVSAVVHKEHQTEYPYRVTYVKEKTQ